MGEFERGLRPNGLENHWGGNVEKKEKLNKSTVYKISMPSLNK